MRSKSKQINFRVTEREYQQLNRKCEASGMSMSKLLLDCALKKEIIKIEGIDELTNELRRIGVNLNQVTKLCNEGRVATVYFKELRDEVAKIWQLLNSRIRKPM